jgi:S1-C subfamily serine protease
LRLLRGTDELTVSATTVRLQGAVGEEREMKQWGLSVREVTPAYANEALLDDDQGVVVTTLSPGYPAAKAQLRPGDVIRAVNSESIEDLDEFIRLFEQSVQQQDPTVILRVMRGRGIRSTVLRVTYGSPPPPAEAPPGAPATLPAEEPAPTTLPAEAPEP